MMEDVQEQAAAVAMYCTRLLLVGDAGLSTRQRARQGYSFSKAKASFFETCVKDRDEYVPGEYAASRE